MGNDGTDFGDYTMARDERDRYERDQAEEICRETMRAPVKNRKRRPKSDKED